MQLDTHTYWRTGEERADRAGGKSAVEGTYSNDAFLTFQAHLNEAFP